MKAKVLFILLFMLLMRVNNAKAATYVWTGLGTVVNNHWNNFANWAKVGSFLNFDYPGDGDIAQFGDLLIPYTVSLSSATTCSQIIVTTVLSNGVTIDTQNNALTVTDNLTVGANPLISLGGVLTFKGSGAVTINKAVTLGSTLFVGLLNCGSPSDNKTNVTIQNANVNLNGPNLLSAINLLGGPSIINNYGKLTITSATANFGVESLLVNNSSGTVTTTASTYKLNNDLASIVNLGNFNVGGTTGTTTNFNLQAGSNGIYNYGTFSAATANSICNLNLTGGASSLISADLDLGILDVSVKILTGSGPSINNYGTFNAGTTSALCSVNLTGIHPTINNATAGTSNGAFNLSSISVIYPTSASAKVTNNSPDCVFTLLSDQNGSATISRVTAGAAVSGKYNVQRFITGNNSLTYRGYRLLSSPVNITSASSSNTGKNYISFNTFKNSYTVAGTSYPGVFTGGPTGVGGGFSVANNNPTIYFYKEPLPTSNTTFISGKNQGVTSIGINQVTLTDGATYNIPVGNGYLFFFIGSTLGRTSGATSLVPDNAFITNIGYINQQSINTYLWYTPAMGAGKLSKASTTTYAGYNSVGNPYPSTLDLNAVYNDNNGTNGVTSIFYQLYDKTQAYVSYNAATSEKSGEGASQYVASGQGFFVVAKTPSSTLTFNETEKTAAVTNPSPIILALKNGRNLALANTNSSAADEQPANVLSGLHLKMQKDSFTYQECGIYFNSAWSDNYDNNDAIYLPGGSQAVVFYSLTADGRQVGINSLGSYTNGKRAKLYVNAAANGIYNMQMEDCLNIDTVNYRIYLVDHFAKDSVNLVNTKSYAFNITNTDSTTFGSNRFELAVEKKPGPPYQLASFTGQKVTNGVQLNWKTSNEGNYTNFSLKKAGATDNQFTSLYSVQGDGSGVYSYTDHNPVTGNNTYRLAQKDVNNVITYSNTVTIIYNAATSSGLVNVYPNPAKETITVGFSSATNGANGNYQANIFNASGATVMNQALNGSNWTQNVSSLKPGTYIIEVRADNGSLIGSSKFSKIQ